MICDLYVPEEKVRNVEEVWEHDLRGCKRRFDWELRWAEGFY
jgi:hypothetical protein